MGRESERKRRVVGKVLEVDGALFPSIDGAYRAKSFWLLRSLMGLMRGMVGVRDVRWEANSGM